MRPRIRPLCLALSTAVAIALAGPAAAVDVEGNRLTVSWAPSQGSPTHYLVWLDYNGTGFPALPDRAVVSHDRRAVVSGDFGDTVRVRVAAGNWLLGTMSDFSEPSEPLRFVPPASETPASSSLIANGSFEEGGDPGSYRTLGRGEWLPGWQVVGDSIDWVGSYWASAHGRRSLDLAGFGAGGVQQTFSTVADRFYSVSLALRASPDCAAGQRARISAAGQHRLYEAPSGSGWLRPPAFYFRAGGSTTTLRIEDTGSNGLSYCGPALDDVAVREVDSSALSGLDSSSFAPPVLANPSFEEGGLLGAFATLLAGEPLFGWEVVGESIDWVGAAWTAAHGERSLDLAAAGSGGVRQTFATIPERFYRVSFSMGANPGCTGQWQGMEITAAGQYRYYWAPAGPGPRNPGWLSPEPFVFQADDWNTTLQIRDVASNGRSHCGAALDDVSIQVVD